MSVHFFSIDINLSKTKIMNFGQNINQTENQEGLYLGDDQIETTHEYKYLGVNYYSRLV
jgi:hypothetical protein